MFEELRIVTKLVGHTEVCNTDFKVCGQCKEARLLELFDSTQENNVVITITRAILALICRICLLEIEDEILMPNYMGGTSIGFDHLGALSARYNF